MAVAKAADVICVCGACDVCDACGMNYSNSITAEQLSVLNKPGRFEVEQTLISPAFLAAVGCSRTPDSRWRPYLLYAFDAAQRGRPAYYSGLSASDGCL